MDKLISFYKDWLGFDQYYNLIISNSENYRNEFNNSSRLLAGFHPVSVDPTEEFSTKDNDLRIDVPVWFGDLNIATNRIVVFGLEPRDTNSLFNIERVGNSVFGTPFGVDRWNHKSTVKGKPQNKYFRVFEELSEHYDTFLIFSDIVKHYQVLSSINKDANDKFARKNFDKHANHSLDKLREEIKLINPTHIVTLGDGAHKIINKLIYEYSNILIKVRHPASNGGEGIATEQIKRVIYS